MNYEQVDGNKNILIDGLGRLLKNGITPVNPVVDPETGLKTFTTPIPGRAGEVETRYVHVEVFRTHGSIKSCPRLEPEDVEFVDEDANPAEKLTNLALSESGRAKVYGGEEENVGVENVEGEDVEDENVEDENVECRSSGVQEEEGISNIEQGIPDDELEEEQSTELQSDEVQSEEDSEVQEPEVQKVEEPSPLSPPAEGKDIASDFANEDGTFKVPKNEVSRDTVLRSAAYFGDFLLKSSAVVTFDGSDLSLHPPDISQLRQPSIDVAVLLNERTNGVRTIVTSKDFRNLRIETFTEIQPNRKRFPWFLIGVGAGVVGWEILR